jgi:hypothetical protein
MLQRGPHNIDDNHIRGMAALPIRAFAETTVMTSEQWSKVLCDVRGTM